MRSLWSLATSLCSLWASLWSLPISLVSLMRSLWSLADVLVLLVGVLGVLDHGLAAVHGDVGGHRRCGRRDRGDRHARALPGVAVGVGRRRRREAVIAGRAGIRVAVVAAVVLELEVPVAVRLDQGDLVVVLVGVVGLVVVDVPDEQPFPGQIGIEAGALTVLDEEVLRAARAVLPQAQDVVAVLDVGDVARPVGGHVGHRRPPLVGLAPGRGVRGHVAAAVPRARRHQAPVPDALGRVVDVVEVREAEEQVAELVRADADLRVLGNGQIGEDLRRVRRVDARQRPLVRPDVARVAGLLAAAAGVHHDEGVDEPVAVVVVGREVDGRIGGGRRVVGQVASPRRPARDRRAVDPEVAVGVPVERVRHPVGADDVAGDVDEAVGRLGVELLDAAVGQHPGREEELLEVRGGRLHLLV